MNRLFILLAVLFMPLLVCAYDAKIDGIYYSLNNKTKQATVTYKSSGINNQDAYIGDVSIPETVTYEASEYSVIKIGNYAFYGCTSLTSVTIPNSVTEIGDYAFRECSGLSSVTIPNSITSIGERAFFNCSGLASVIIPESVTSIGSSAFYCPNLTKVELNSNAIVSKSYSSSSSLMHIFGGQVKDYILGKDVTKIGKYAFYGCPNLASVIIPNNVTSIGSSAFYCPNLTKVELNSNAIVSKLYSSSFSLMHIFGGQVKEYIIGKDVTKIGMYAFYGCSEMVSISISNSVTEIGDYIFNGCSGLTSISVESNNTIYDSRENCNAIIETATNSLIAGCKNSTIPNNVTSIGNSAFSGCSSLTSVTIPNNVTSIGNSAFSGCSSLTSVTIPNNVTSIGNSAFLGCSGLTSIIISNSISSISRYTFYGCSGLTSITIPNSVTLIGEYAFCKCKGLTSIIIPNGVTTIGVDAFNSCSGLTEVNFPNSVTEIGSYAFSGCSSLTSVTIPNSVTEIGSYAFNCPNLTKVELNSNTIVSKSYSSSSSLKYIFGSKVKEYIIGNGVTGIGIYAFNGCSEMTSITIPNSVTEIGDYAFGECMGLTYVTLPNSVTSIGKCAFENCSGLTSVTIPNNVTSIGSSAFNCPNLTKVELNSNAIVSKSYGWGSSLKSIFGGNRKEYIIGNDVTKVGREAFCGCSDMKSITIPNSVMSIESYAFQDCSALTSVSIPNSVTSIEYGAFKDCSGLSSVTIPNSVISIGGYAFYGCTSLASITIPNSVTSIGGYAFDNTIWYNNQNDGVVYIGKLAYKYKGEMPQNTSLFINEGTLYVSDFAFSDCSGLTSVTIPNSVTEIGYHAFSGCSNLTSATIGNNVKSIGEMAFYGCSALKKIEINSNYIMSKDNIGSFFGYQVTEYILGDNVVKIGDEAFQWCSNLTTVTIPNSVTSIGERAFQYCSALTSVSIPNSVTSIGSDAFSQCSSMTSVTMGNNVTSIGSSAFSGCSSLTSVIIPNNVKKIEGYTFSDCSSLTSAIVGENVTLIGYNAFSGCIGLTAITIPESVTEIGNDAFERCFFEKQNFINNSRLDEKGNNYWGATIIDSKENGFIIRDGVLIKYVGNETSVIIPSSVTTIGSSAFSGCSVMTSVTIPSSVTSIGSSAFMACDGLTSITIPNSVNFIRDYAFCNCSKLSSVIIPNSVISIGHDAFDNTAWYNKQPNGVVYAGLVAYKYKGTMPSNTSITLKGDTKGISEDAFYGFNNLNSIMIPSTVTEIGDYAFWGCNSLRNISVRTINPPKIMENTFSDYSATLDVLNGTQDLYKNHEYWKYFLNISEKYNIDIDQYTDIVFFEDATAKSGSEKILSLKMKNSKDISALMFDLYLPDGVTLNTNTYGNFIISYNKESKRSVPTQQDIYSSRQADGAVRVICYGNNADIIVGNEGEVYDFPIKLSKKIADGNHKIMLKNIEMTSPQGESTEIYVVTSNLVISDDASDTRAEIDGIYYFFNHSTKTATVTYGSSSYNSYSGNVTIPSTVVYNGTTYNVKGIGDYAFAKCTELISVTIPNSVTMIGNNAFAGCTKVTSMTIPESVKSIEEGTFSGCESLASLTVANDNTTFDSRDNSNAIIETARNMLIAGCKATIIPSSVTAIGNSAFSECRSMTSVTFPESVTGIGNYAFYGCTGLTSVTIPNSVTTIGNNAFQNCKNMSSVNITNGITAIKGAVFSGCSGLESAIIPNGITAIGSNAFNGCSGITTMIIPESVKSIGFNTFDGCNIMETIDVSATTPPNIGENTFSDYSALLLVANGCKEIYQETNYWKNFYTIIDGTDQKIPLTYYDYEGTPKTLAYRTTWSRVLDSTPNAIAVVESSDKDWAESQTNVLVKDGDTYYCPYFVLTDLTQDYSASAKEAMKTGFYTPYEFTVIKGTYKRTPISGFKTLCLPFDLSVSELTSTAKLYTYDNYDKQNGLVTFKRIKGGHINAGNPCIIYDYDNSNYNSNSNVMWNVNLSNKKISAQEPSNSTYMRGTYVTTNQYQGIGYSVGSYGGFAPLANYLHPFRACFIPENALFSRGLRIKFIDDDEIQKEDSSEDNVPKTIYTLSGIRINNIIVSGIYIINGKKTYVEVK